MINEHSSKIMDVIKYMFYEKKIYQNLFFIYIRKTVEDDFSWQTSDVTRRLRSLNTDEYFRGIQP